jgi:hypothetical protein
MASQAQVLLQECPDPYRPGVARPPKNFRIAWVSVEPREPTGYLQIGPDTAVPTLFEANVQLANPEAAVAIEVFVGGDLRPVVIELRIRTKVRTPVTTSMLRTVLVDQMLQAAMEEATVPLSVREDWLATLPPAIASQAPTWETQTAPPSAEQRVSRNAEVDARTAARVYQEALATGSKAPAVVVAHTMNRSRAQVARYIRRAREMGLLPALEPTQGAAGLE